MHFQDDDLLIEITRVGDWQRVAVVEAGSGREVIVHGPATAPPGLLIATARHRLRLALRRPALVHDGGDLLA